MAKCKYRINDDFNHICNHIKREILSTSSSASLEDEEYLNIGDVRMGILVFERYSYSGGNRLSLHVTVIEKDNIVDIIGISSGGSNGLFFKVNTWGEDAFLEKLKEAIKKL
ncbi:MAG: DUF6054 family protein [Bacilli bacterium]|nr:DUF6054 family protein [Bacilli bacterium]